MNGCCVCVCVCVCAHTDQTRILWNWHSRWLWATRWVQRIESGSLWKNSQCSQPLSHLSSPESVFSKYNSFLLFLDLFVLFLWVHCSCLHTHQKRTSDPITDGCEPPCGCWELNSGPLEEQSVLLTAEPSLLPLPPCFLIFWGGCFCLFFFSLYVCVCVVCFETGFLCVVPAVLELTL